MNIEAELAAAQSDNRGGWPAALLIAATFFIATAPTLSWVEFSSGMENLTVSTVLEIHRNGRWLVPTLQGEPRTAKPPLASWLCALAVPPHTFRDLDSRDAKVRDAAYRSLAWQMRWPALLSSCLMLLAIFHCGRTIGGVWTGLLAMTIAGSTLYWLRFGKQATTDVQLALWTSIAMAALARICLMRTTWLAAMVAGAALALALMSKGPVALLQTIAPAAAFCALARKRIRILPMVTGLVIMIIIGGAWYAWVAMQVPTVWERWRLELTRASPVERSGNTFSYLSLLAYMMPWTVVLIHGAIWTAVEAFTMRRKGDGEARDGWLFALLLLIVPIIVMSCFPDRKERYLLPMLTPAAIIAARGLSAMLDSTDRRRVPPIVQWAIVLVIAIGLPLAGMLKLKRDDGTSWYTPQVAMMSIAFLAALIGIASAAARKWPLALAGAVAGAMLLLQPLFYSGYRFSSEGRSEMRPLAKLVWDEFPDAEAYYLRPQGPRRVPGDFSIYLNRIAPWVGDPADIRPSRRPQVYITLTHGDAPAPPPPPIGWSYFARIKRDADWYHAFVREPSDASTQASQ